jgi:hypothetical protein
VGYKAHLRTTERIFKYQDSSMNQFDLTDYPSDYARPDIHFSNLGDFSEVAAMVVDNVIRVMVPSGIPPEITQSIADQCAANADEIIKSYQESQQLLNCGF